MLVALTLAAAAPTITAIDAERAFAADAQKLGQWTAFRAWSTPDALMFTPQPVKAHVFLKDRKDPPVAVFWWPGRSYISCDGSYAVNTGPWVREWGKSVGYFTTVWKRQPDGSWKWIFDAGDELKTARAEGGDIKPAVAACSGKKLGMLMSPPRPGEVGGGKANDQSLVWRWSVAKDGARTFEAWIWNGARFERVIHDEVAAQSQ